MSKRPEPLTPQQQAEVGIFVLGMRLAGLPWKEIERQFSMSKVQLWRYACLAKAQAADDDADLVASSRRRRM